MKKLVFTLLVIISCSENKPEANISKPVTKIDSVEKAEKYGVPDNIVLNAWQSYYEKDNPGFSFNKFQKESESAIAQTEIQDKSLMDKDFPAYYKPFLIFSPDKTKYIDFDSYQWQPDDKGNASFEADQKVVLVDLKSKTVKQIAFYGPSFWIEEGYWQNNDELILLGNTYEKVPFYTRYDFKNNRMEFFRSADTLIYQKPYSEKRLLQFGVKVD